MCPFASKVAFTVRASGQRAAFARDGKDCGFDVEVQCSKGRQQPHEPHQPLPQAFTIVTRAVAKYSGAIEKLTGQEVEWLDGDLSTLEIAEEVAEKPHKDAIKSDNAGRKARDI